MNTSSSKALTYDDNEQDTAYNCNSIHDTDTSNPEDGDDKKSHVLKLYHKRYYKI